MFYKVQIISFLSVAGRSFGSVHFHGVSKMYHCHKSSCLLQLQISHLVMFHVKTYYQTRWKTLEWTCGGGMVQILLVNLSFFSILIT